MQFYIDSYSTRYLYTPKTWHGHPLGSSRDRLGHPFGCARDKVFTGWKPVPPYGNNPALICLVGRTAASFDPT